MGDKAAASAGSGTCRTQHLNVFSRCLPGMGGMIWCMDIYDEKMLRRRRPVPVAPSMSAAPGRHRRAKKRGLHDSRKEKTTVTDLPTVE